MHRQQQKNNKIQETLPLVVCMEFNILAALSLKGRESKKFKRPQLCLPKMIEMEKKSTHKLQLLARYS